MLTAGLRLLGVFFFVSTVGSIAYLPTYATNYDRDSQSMILAESWEILVLSLLAAILVLKALPSWLLIQYAPKVAGLLEAGEDTSGERVSRTDIYVPLATLLALFFLVTGAGLFLTGGIQLASEIFEESVIEKTWSIIRYSIGSTLDGAVRMIASVVIYYHALGLATRRRQSSDA